ncbi:MAG: hypothetical protein ACR2O4_16980 [Hyphomicrobiaceae bacterium]
MPEPAKTPWHLWIVGVVALLLNAGSAYDYVMTQTRNAAYLSEFTAEQLAYFYSFPSWVVAVWATAVWTGVLGALFLLMRRRWAVPVLWLSFACTIVTAVYMYLVAETSIADVIGPSVFYFSMLIIAFAGLLVWYAQRMQARGVLR